MRILFALFLLLTGCVTSVSKVVINDKASAFSVSDYLKTAYDTLLEAETDTGGHRIRAQLETRAALDLLANTSVTPRSVPFEGPPSLAVALVLLEKSEHDLKHEDAAPALDATRRALKELRAALNLPSP
jgi:hypothetical protein